MTEEERRRFSLPSIKAQHVQGNQGSQDIYNSHSRTPSTYPPAGPRQNQASGGLYPPGDSRGPSSSSGGSQQNHSHSPGNMSPMPVNTGSASMYSQSGMTESPKPLSPSGMHSHQLGHDPSSINRQRSPSLTTQLQQQQFGRRPEGRASPTGMSMSLPSPLGTSPSGGHKLPSLSGLAPPDSRFTVLSQSPAQNGSSQNQNPNQNQQPNQHPAPTSPNPSYRSGPQQPPADTNNVFADGNRGVWAYCQTLEERVKVLQEELTTLRGEKKAALDQVAAQQEQLGRLAEENNFLHSQIASQPPPAS